MQRRVFIFCVLLGWLLSVAFVRADDANNNRSSLVDLVDSRGRVVRLLPHKAILVRTVRATRGAP